MTSSTKPGRTLSTEREFRVGNLSTPVRVRIYRRISDDALIIEQSHFIKTSLQYLPYSVRDFVGTKTEVLDQVVTTMTNFYEEAVRRGYSPSESWLVPNSNFPH